LLIFTADRTTETASAGVEDTAELLVDQGSALSTAHPSVDGE
jgi:hypothetical protein